MDNNKVAVASESTIARYKDAEVKRQAMLDVLHKAGRPVFQHELVKMASMEFMHVSNIARVLIRIGEVERLEDGSIRPVVETTISSEQVIANRNAKVAATLKDKEEKKQEEHEFRNGCKVTVHKFGDKPCVPRADAPRRDHSGKGYSSICGGSIAL
jgi:hypothetical protein